MPTDETRHAILDAAERLFAQQGYAGTSVREITREAGVNVAAVHYHFGGKEELLRGVTDRIVEPLNRRRLDLLDAVLRRPDPTLEDIVDAFIRPDIETLQGLHARGATVAHMLGAVYTSQEPWIREMTDRQFAVAGRRFLSSIEQMVPNVAPVELAWRTQQMAALIVNLFATWPDDGMDDAEAEALVRRMVAVISALLRADDPIEGG